MTSRKKEQLEDEMKELFYRADTHFKEACGYLEAAYHVACDLQKLDPPNEHVVADLIVQLKQALITENKQMNTSLKNLKTRIKDVVGVDVGVEDYESESED